MSQFGSRLRVLRHEAELTQRQLAAQLGFGRSTLANIEAGREPPSSRFAHALQTHHPLWWNDLQPLLGQQPTSTVELPEHDSTADTAGGSAGWVLGGPFVVEHLTLVYCFEHSQSPSEIIEVRRVRATRNRADSYGLKLVNTQGPGLETTEEALWGGYIDHEFTTASGYVRRFRFDRTLRRGQTHEFATRQWVERDPNPGTAVSFSMTIPASTVDIHLHFTGPKKPVRTLRFGPLVDDADIPEGVPLEGGVPLGPGGTGSAYFRQPQPGATYGIAWEW